MSNNRYAAVRVCSVCGDGIGVGLDHTECSKLKAEMYGRCNERKNPKRKMSPKECDALCDHVNFITNLPPGDYL